MADKYGFHREAIITGCVDSFCLACEEYLKCEREVITHVTKPVHRKNLLTVQYVDKYRDDHIRKVKKGYFCELCNLLLPTATKVGLHVAEPRHVDNKATKLLKSIGNTVIALGNVSISERAWHGLMEDTCAICNVEYDDEDIHKNQPSHIIRLIQCKVQYGANKGIYRLIDNDTFQCLTCNMVISLETITEHFNNSEHHKLYSECLVSANPEELNDPAKNYLEGKQKVLSDKETINDKDLQEKWNDRKNQDPAIIKNKYESQHTEMSNEDNRKKILDSVNQIQRSDINIDFENQSAFCRKCLTALDFDCGLIEQHMQEHLHKTKEMGDSALSYPTVNQNHNKTRLTQCDEPTFDKPTSDNKNRKDDESNTHKNNIRPLTGADESKSDIYKDIDGGIYENCDSPLSSSSEHSTENETKPCGSNVTEDPSVSEVAMQKITTNKIPKSEPRRKDTNSFSKQSKPTEKFIEEFVLVNNDFMQAKRVIINRKYLVDIDSFMLVTKQDSGIRCQVCEVNFIEDDCTDHVNSSSHKKELNKIPVITSLDTEFVREVRPGLFHCGYCHLLVSDWDTLHTHMKCSEHKEIKSLSKMLLDRNIEIFRLRRARETLYKWTKNKREYAT